jgi:ABC-type nitrate/sulfonate/bicarbonate transport system substrate-binding protein
VKGDIMQSRRRFLRTSLYGAAALGFRPALGFAADAQPGTKERPLTIATGHFFGYLPSYRLADQMNAAGVVTKLIEFPSATERVEAVSAGYADVAYAGLTASVLLRARGKKVVVVASADQKGRALISGQNIGSIEALKGKTIGVTFASIEQMTLIALLQQHGFDTKRDVNIINVPTTDLPIALKNGQVDAFMAFEPWGTFAVKKYGAKVLAYPYGTPLGAIDGGIEFEQSFVERYPDLVKKVVDGQIEAVKFYQANPQAVVAAGVKNFNVSEDIMQAALSNVELTYALDPAPIKVLAGFQRDLGMLSAREYEGIDWKAFVNTAFVA